jgi:glutamate dehydrogenase (NADP+)
MTRFLLIRRYNNTKGNNMKVKEILSNLTLSNCTTDTTFFQAVEEVLDSIIPAIQENSQYEKHNIIQRILTPDREIKFKVEWLGDNGSVQVNNGYRIQFNNVLGPYKGGLRFHPSVNAGVLKFLAFEQIFKNALTGLPIGGGKGGSDFDPKNKSDAEIMKFCYAFMTELHKYIGPRIDVPAGDIGVGAREIGYLFGAYKKMTSRYEGVLTGKPIFFGGSVGRPEATGYGVVYFARELLEDELKTTLKDKICSVSGSGNVAIYTIEKLQELGAKVITCSDSSGSIYDDRGINLELLKELKLTKRARLSEYVKTHKEAQYIPVEEYPEDGHFVWSVKCDMAFPCATQNELTLKDAKSLIKHNTIAVVEGANMPSTKDAMDLFNSNDILFAPAKASNAGGVSVSEFEMSQNSSMTRWGMEKVDTNLQFVMKEIYRRISTSAKQYDTHLSDGANIYAFKKVADAMIAQGV